MIPTVFKKLKGNLEERSQAKKMLESIIPFTNANCSSESLKTTVEGNSIRLLDEGVVLNGGDKSIRMWICKNSIQNFYDSLEDDFVGYITIGHMDLMAFPLLLGTWTKQDLEIVDLGNDRKGLNCTPHLNTELSIVKDLLSQEIPLSVSVEFNAHTNETLSESLGANVVDEIFIQGFSLVGDPANVSSSDVKFKGEDMTFKELLEKFADVPEEIVAVDENAKDESVEEEKETAKTEEKVEEKVEEKAVEEKSEELSDDMDSMVEKFSGLLDEMQAKIDTLSQENADLKQKLADSNKAKKEFSDEIINKFNNLMNSQTTKKKDSNDVFGVGNLK